MPLPEWVDAKKFVWVSSLESPWQIHATYTSLHTDGKNDYVCQFPVVYSCEEDWIIVRVTQTIHHGTRKTLVPLHDIARLLASWIVTQDMVDNDPTVIQYKRKLKDKIMGLQAQLDAAMGGSKLYSELNHFSNIPPRASAFPCPLLRQGIFILPSVRADHMRHRYHHP